MPSSRRNKPAAPKQRSAPKNGVEKTKLTAVSSPAEQNSADRMFQIAVALIFALSLALRFDHLSIKPFHNDEGVNGYFLDNLFLHNQYAYDPRNYHGPSLYYLALPFVYLFGPSVATLRSVPIVFSLITLWQILCLRKRITARGSVYAALFLCISPGAVFFARYFIHETLVACFTLGIAITAWDYAETRKRSSLLWCSLSAGMLFATKETAAVECAILAASAFCMHLWISLLRRHQPSTAPPAEIKPAQTADAMTWLQAAGIFLGVNFVLYSSFFTHYHGVIDAIHSPLYWFGRSGNEQVHPWWQYFNWLALEEPALLIVGSAGVIAALIKCNNRFAVFCAFWAMGTLCAYSLMGYKTPWLVLNMLVPMAIVGGYIFAEIPGVAYRGILAAALCAASLIVAVSLNFYHYDSDRSPYVYAQTQRSIFDLLRAIRVYSDSRHDNGQTSIAIVSPDYWPLPWYLRRDDNAAYWGKIQTLPADTRLIIANENQEPQITQLIGNRYVLQGRYGLRPGVVLDLYVRTFN